MIQCPKCHHEFTVKVTKEDALKVLNYLNKKAGRQFPATEVNLGFIRSRMKESDLMTCIRVINYKVNEWRFDEKMKKFLRPATLFNATKFSQYAGEIPLERKPIRRIGVYNKSAPPKETVRSSENLVRVRELIGKVCGDL